MSTQRRHYHVPPVRPGQQERYGDRQSANYAIAQRARALRVEGYTVTGTAAAGYQVSAGLLGAIVWQMAVRPCVGLHPVERTGRCRSTAG